MLPNFSTEQPLEMGYILTITFIVMHFDILLSLKFVLNVDHP